MGSFESAPRALLAPFILPVWWFRLRIGALSRFNSESMTSDAATSLLRLHYPVVQTLSAYLVDILLPKDDSIDEDPERSFETMVDSPEFHDFMTTTLVATKVKPKPRAAPFTVFSPKHSMKDVSAASLMDAIAETI